MKRLKVKITVNMTKKDKENLSIVKKLKDFDCTISLKEPKLVGRALKNVNEEDLYSFNLSSKEAKVPCDQIGLPAITPDGRVWVCCGIPSAKFYNKNLIDTPLIMGSIMHSSLEDILNKSRNNIILKILKNLGAFEFVKIIEKYGDMRFEPQRRYFRICDLCCDILGNERYLDILKKFVEKNKIYY